MYVQPLDLGRFDVPEVEDWPLKVVYIPEPPQAIRGAMNPWELERKRILWMRENEAWKQIQTLQGQYRGYLNEYNYNVTRFNQLIGEIENQTGKKGLQRIMGSKGFQAASLAVTTTNPYGAIIAAALVAVNLLETGFKILSGEAKRKKKRIKELQNALEEVGRNLDRLTGILSTLAQQILALTMTKEEATKELTEMVQRDTQASADMYRQRQAAERSKGEARAAFVNALRQQGTKRNYNDAL